MNRTHRFFYQVQGQLNITKRNYCIFAIWTPKSLKIVTVKRDKDFWENKMLPSLTLFYYECMLPEILDSRHNRHMPIRNPQYILDAQEKASKNKVSCKRRTVQQNDTERESKQLQLNVSATDATNIAAVLKAEQDSDSDCVLVSYSINKRNLTEDEIANRKKVLDNTIASLSVVKNNVLPVQSKLNDK